MYKNILSAIGISTLRYLERNKLLYEKAYVILFCIQIREIIKYYLKKITYLGT